MLRLAVFCVALTAVRAQQGFSLGNGLDFTNGFGLTGPVSVLIPGSSGSGLFPGSGSGLFPGSGIAPGSTCASIRCPFGFRCNQPVFNCIRAPCIQPPPECVPVGGPIINPGINLQKPGQCPRFSSRFGRGQVGICAFTCGGDSECSGSRKCCTTPCGGTTCQEPQQSSCPVNCPFGSTCQIIQQPCRYACPPAQFQCVPTGLSPFPRLRSPDNDNYIVIV